MTGLVAMHLEPVPTVSSIAPEQVKKQHGWGDMTDEEYIAKRDDVKAMLATLPDSVIASPASTHSEPRYSRCPKRSLSLHPLVERSSVSWSSTTSSYAIA